MLISFHCISAGVPSRKTKRVYPPQILEKICYQINNRPSELLITNQVSDTGSVDLKRVCGSVIRGSAHMKFGIIYMEASFLVKDFHIEQPYEYNKESMAGMDLKTGNILEKLTKLGMIEYSPVGTGSIETKFVNRERVYEVTEYTISYVLGQPKDATHAK